jgi:excinuclease ABC subunit A
MCPFCDQPVPILSANQMIDHIQTLPDGTVLDVLAPVYKLYGEDFETLFDEIRTKGFRTIRIDGVPHSLGDPHELDEELDYQMEVVVDKVIVQRDIFKVLTKTIENSLNLIGEGFIRFDIVSVPEGRPVDREAFYRGFACPEHHLTLGELQPTYFSFNDPDSACRTCGGIGTFMRTEAKFLIKNAEKSIMKGALDPKVLGTNTSTWRFTTVTSLAKHYGFDVDVPLKELPEWAIELLFYGTKGEKFEFLPPDDAPRSQARHAGRKIGFGGLVGMINRWYKQYQKRKVLTGAEDEFFKRVMVEHTCPDCEGKKLKQQRFCIKVGGADIHELSTMPLQELQHFLQHLAFSEEKEVVARQIGNEIQSRLSLLLDIGLEYLSLGRRSDTISGGEAQRIRLSTQISSGLMGMLYVLDEPSIGLHARDSHRIVETLKKLRDIGNTIIVVEHDIDTICSADHIIEIGPGPGVRGGHVIAQGTAEQLRANPQSVTGSFLSGENKIEVPSRRRYPAGLNLSIRGARANNLRNVDVDIPLGVMVCITGVSGSGKSTLINEVLYKQLTSLFQDARIVPGEHDSLEGHEHLSAVINIDQSPIGRSSRSNPATYVGFFDRIRELYAEAAAASGKSLGKHDFSFNQKNGGRCEHCQGEGIVTTTLQFMPDVESVCPVCKGARFNEEVLDVRIKQKNLAQVLEMPIEEAVQFFADQPYILHKLNVLNELGLGYVRLGQSSTTLSGGEAQRIKLATELGKMKRGSHNLYILDEPTTGLHLQDIQKLIACVDRLVDSGHSVIIIEHHLDMIKVADHIIDMGPEGGKHGGTVVATGTPEQIAKSEHSLTGRFLREVLTVESSFR